MTRFRLSTIKMSDNINDKLWHAAGDGDEALVSQLIEQGAKVNWGGEKSAHWTALHQAASNGHTHVVTRLLDSGWSPEAMGALGDTPLIRAAACGRLQTVKTLMLRGANIDTQDVEKRTPIHVASSNGQSRVVKILLQCGADQLIKDQNRNTAEDAAKNKETREVFREFNEPGQQTANILLAKAINENNHDVGVILILRGAKLVGASGNTLDRDFVQSVLNFLSFALNLKAKNFQEKLGEGFEQFCLRRNRRGGTLLQYIADHGLVKEREELLQLLIKIDKQRYEFIEDESERWIIRILDKHRYKFNEEESERRIIRILRAGMKPCKGLKETIDSLQDKYSWTTGKMIVRGLLSTLRSFAVGFVFFFFDVGTDIKFSVEMFSHTTTNFTEDLERCQAAENLPHVSNITNFCNNHGLDSEDCIALINSAIQTCNQYKERFHQPGVWQDIGIVTAAHIALPFLLIFCFFGLLILNKIISINWLLPLRIPWPPLAKTYEAILNWQIFYNYTDKCKKSYESQHEDLMTKVEKHMILTNLSLTIEASFESSFQFFFQGVFFFPTLILACMDVSGASELKNLVDWKIVSIIFSFLSFSWTSLNIR